MAPKPVSKPRRNRRPSPEQTDNDSLAPALADILLYLPPEFSNDSNGFRAAAARENSRQALDLSKKSGSPWAFTGKKAVLRIDLMQRKSP